MTLNPDQLPVAVVSGASRGLGKATAEALARANYHVVMLCRDVRDAAEHAMGLSRSGLSVEPRKVDVASSVAVNSVSKHIRDEYGRVDLLINNAGIFVDREPDMGEHSANPLHVSVTAVMQTFNINTMGAMRLTQALAPMMPSGGRIVNVSSSLGLFGELEGDFLGYRMSKTALNSMTLIFAKALAEQGVIVNAASPGWVRTDMGGAEAPRDINEGIDTILWLATSAEATESGGFYRDRKKMAW